MHFMNPVPLKPIVEVIRGYHTAQETIERTRQLLSRMGKEAVVVKDASGFVSNRVLMLTVNEAIFLVHEGVATAEEVDEVFRSCFGHPMGPLETADLIGARHDPLLDRGALRAATTTASTGPARCSSRWSTPACTAARPARASTTTASP